MSADGGAILMGTKIESQELVVSKQLCPQNAIETNNSSRGSSMGDDNTGWCVVIDVWLLTCGY